MNNITNKLKKVLYFFIRKLQGHFDKLKNSLEKKLTKLKIQ